MRKGGWTPRRGAFEGETEHERNKRLRGVRERRMRKEYRHPRGAEAEELGCFRIKL